MDVNKYYGFLRLTLFVLMSFTNSVRGYITDPDECVTADYHLGICTELAQCRSILTLTIDGGRPMPRYVREKLKEEHCGFNASQPKVCCPAEIKNDYFPPPNVIRHRNYDLLPRNCGKMTEAGTYGTSTAGIYEYPWKALIAYNNQSDVVTFGCGGTIISEYYILTAAHCLANTDDGKYVLGVRVGESNIQTDPDCEFTGKKICIPRHVDYLIEESFVHADYDSRTRQHDIGLIRLMNRIDFDIETSGPICLPITPILAVQDFEGQNMRISGWGLNLVADYRTPDYKFASTPIVANTYCAAIYRRTPIVITHMNMCAGGDGASDSCNGDSGGPLQAPGLIREGHAGYVQYGIVSVGPGRCGVAGSPNIYTRVAYYMDWILDHMRQ